MKHAIVYSDDETRFVLKEIGSDGSDYINASFVDVSVYCKYCLTVYAYEK